MRAAIYCRISDDRAGAGLGVERQRQDCERLIAERAWTLVREPFTDNDLSAYSGVERPAYRRLLETMGTGQIDVVVAWHTDRLHRSPREMEDLIDLCEQTGVVVHTVQAGPVDLSSPAGRAVARTLTAWARYESEHKSARIRRKHESLAREGKPSGSMLAYGHNADGTIHEAQAAVIRDLVSRVLGGESLHALVNDLNSRGVPTLRGGTWRTSTVRSMLSAARLCGWREWTPRTEGRGYGLGEMVAPSPVVQPIISRAETDRLRALLSDPARRTYRPAEHLLSAGVLRCGLCGEVMNSRSDKGHGRRYACIRHPGTEKCGRITIVAEPVDLHVTAMLLEALADVDLTPAVEQADDEQAAALSQIDADSVRLITLATDFADGAITRPEWLAARDRIEARVQAARAGLASHDRRVALDGLPTGREDLEAAWEAWSLDRRRSVLRAVIDRVTVHPAVVRGRPTFDPGRLLVAWRV